MASRWNRHCANCIGTLSFLSPQLPNTTSADVGSSSKTNNRIGPNASARHRCISAPRQLRSTIRNQFYQLATTRPRTKLITVPTKTCSQS